MLSTKKLLYKLLQMPFVIEEGVVGVANYRKWSDGTLEQWGIIQIPASAGNASTSVSLASPFVNTDYIVQITGGYNATGVVILAENNFSNGNRERTASSFKVSAYKNGFAYYVGFSFYVIGKWK